MKPDARFLDQPKEFWAHIRSISQEIGYTTRADGYLPVPEGLKIPRNFRKHGGPARSTVRAIGLEDIVRALHDLTLSADHIVDAERKPRGPAQLLCDYFQYRADVLNNYVSAQLNDAAKAMQFFEACKRKYKSRRPFVMNKQKGNKRAPAFAGTRLK